MQSPAVSPSAFSTTVHIISNKSNLQDLDTCDRDIYNRRKKGALRMTIYCSTVVEVLHNGAPVLLSRITDVQMRRRNQYKYDRIRSAYQQLFFTSQSLYSKILVNKFQRFNGVAVICDRVG